MNKISFLFLLLLCSAAILALYHAIHPMPSTIALNRFVALMAFGLVCVSLIIGPLVVFWPKEFALLIEPRRAVGLAAFIFAAVHIIIGVVLYFGWNLDATIAALPLAPQTLLAALLLVVLAITSNDYSIKVLGPVTWKNVQRLNYLVFVFVFAHFVVKSNGLIGAARLNYAEVGLVVLGIATIIVQVAGFLKRKSRSSVAAASKETPPTSS